MARMTALPGLPAVRLALVRTFPPCLAAPNAEEEEAELYQEAAAESDFSDGGEGQCQGCSTGG